MSEAGQYHKKYPIIQSSVMKELSHGICVSNLAYHTGKKLGFAEMQCHELAIAGFLHDIGKLELTKYVNGKKEETLIVEEMKYVRRHSSLGANYLEQVGYPKTIVDMVRYHHENCDGSGYPNNLTQEEIPFGARIIRVCDVFAALTTDRPYRRAFDADTAIELMIDESRYYDIQVFLAFLRVIHEDGLDQMINHFEVEESLSRLIWMDEELAAYRNLQEG